MSFPGTAGYGHFRFNDYAKLTVIGVVIGAAGWPVLTHVSSAPRWLYGWLTVLISLALFLPDAWLLIRGQPLKEVAVLMVMHVGVAVVIYCSMVLIAPAARDPQPALIGSGRRRRRPTSPRGDASQGSPGMP